MNELLVVILNFFFLSFFFLSFSIFSFFQLLGELYSDKEYLEKLMSDEGWCLIVKSWNFA